MSPKQQLLCLMVIGLSITACQNTSTTNLETSVADSSLRYGPDTHRPETAKLVINTLATIYKSDIEKNLIDSFSRTFVFFEYDLNEDGRKEIFVSHTGPYYCGSGGCNLLLLSPDGKLITQFTVSRTPVIVLRERSKGWNDLLIESAGKLHLLKYDGNSYPSNPSVAPVFTMIPGDELPRLLDTEHEPFPKFSF
ncbi:hypothetical protein GCM10027036_35360 [Flavihumibacter cheonanensis]|uniref:hypothetical protein n=1 Tax=Flavihumibacter cheonanensis TaxID=1442385 RepID=UPI001EF996B9|nr:hypothetical protein [Flavihumibacter cheonanensis]MCG7753539.1 hypothetical protein [Flavihumibacter cheonanensis]